MEKHITFLGVITIAFGVTKIMVACFFFSALMGAGIISGDDEVIFILSIVATSIAFMLFIMSLPHIIGGIGLLKRKNWARMLVLIIACLDLLCIPVGTAVGVYGIWVLLNDKTPQLFEKSADQKDQDPA